MLTAEVFLLVLASIQPKEPKVTKAAVSVVPPKLIATINK